MKKQKKIPLVVSIDFDFFIENDPMLDMGHREEGIFLNTMWAIRQAEWMAIRGKTAREMMPMRERPEDFVGQLRALLDIPFGLPAFAAESHAMLPKALDMAGIARCDIVNFDAHHDIAYGQCPKNLREKYDCGSWAGHLLDTGRVRNYTQVYPDWRIVWPELDKETQLMMAAQWEARFCYWRYFSADLVGGRSVFAKRKLDIAAVFICRSGCWTPPCYDKDFSLLCRMFGIEPLAERAEPDIVEHMAAIKEIAEKGSQNGI